MTRPKQAELVDLRRHELSVAEVSGIVYEADGHNSEPGPRDRVLEALRAHKRAWLNEQELLWRVETLQEELATIKAKMASDDSPVDATCETCAHGELAEPLYRHCERPDTFGRHHRTFGCADWRARDRSHDDE